MPPARVCLLSALIACGPSPPGTSDTSAATGTDSSPAFTETSDAPDTPTSTGTPACLATTGDDSGTTAGETTGAPVVCPPVDGQPCTAPVDCDGQFCGSHVSLLDEHGCPRAVCDDDTDCGPGEGCMRNEGLDPLFAPVRCEDNGTCNCALGQGVVSGVCLPVELLPGTLSEHCAGLALARDCSRFDVPWPHYCRWIETQVFCDGACGLAGASAACVAFEHAGDGCSGDCEIDGMGGYSRPRPGASEFFLNPQCGDEPVGWQACIFAGTEACACVCPEF